VSQSVRSRDKAVPQVTEATPSSWDVVYALNMAMACLISYWIMTHILSRFVDRPSDFLGGMWAAAATVFVFRESQIRSLSAGIGRLVAACVSFALCLLYLLIFPFTGMAALIGTGTVAITLLGRRDDIVTTGITTAVVMVVAAMSPVDAWPLLRLADTVVGTPSVLRASGRVRFCFTDLLGRRHRDHSS
jgi:hypothetical protein